MRIFVGFSSICLSVSLFAGSLVAADAPDLIPSSAAAVIRLKAPDKTIESLADFINEVQPGFGALIQGQAGMMGVGISNPTMQGVDKSRDFWGAVFLKKDEEPVVVFLIPATDVDKMKEAIDESFEFIAHEDFGIYTEDKEVADSIRKHLENPRSQAIGDGASDTMIKLVTGSDAALVLNLVAIKEVYAAELSEGKEKLQEGIEKAQEEMLEIPGINLDWVPGLMKTVGDKLFTVVGDSQAYAVTLTFSESGLELQEYLEFEEGSSSADFLANNLPGSLDILKKLPSDQLFYGAFGGNISALNQWGITLLPQILDLTEEQEKKWEEVSKKAKGIKYGPTAASFTLGNTESGLIRATTASEVAPAKAIREIVKIAGEAMSELELPGGMKQEMTFEPDFEKIDGISVDLMTTKVISDGDQFGGFQSQINQIMYGGESIETRIAYLDGVSLSTVGGGKESMKSSLAAFKSGAAGADRVVSRDLKPFGEKNNAILIIDVPTMIVKGLKIAASSPLLPPMPFDEESVEDLDVERSYIGFSVKTSKTGCVGKMHVPIETFKAGMTLFGFFQQLKNNENAF